MSVTNLRCPTVLPCFFVIVSCLAGSLSGDEPRVADGAGESVSDHTVAGMTIADCERELQSENRVVRLRSVRTLGMFDGAAAKPLLAALHHDDPAVRFLAATQLGRIGGDSLAAAVETLKTLADSEGRKPSDGPVAVNIAAAYALCEAGQVQSFLPILIDAVSDPERGTACYAADLIGRLGADASAATDVLEKTYEQNKPGVKGGDYHIGGAAMNALRKIRGELK